MWRGPAFQVPGIKAPFLACEKPKPERKPHKQSGGGEERRGARKAFLGTSVDHLPASVLSPCQAPGKWEKRMYLPPPWVEGVGWGRVWTCLPLG